MLAMMAVSTVPFFALAVIASELQDEFDISKFELGVLAAVNTGIGALFAPTAGRLSDSIGARNSVLLTLVSSAASAAVLALASSFGLLIAGAAVGGIAQGAGNPAANKAISVGVDEAKRGVATGIKQSGVQVGVAIAGFTTPLMGASYGWRSAMWMYAALAVLAMAGLRLVPGKVDGTGVPVRPTDRSGPLPTFATYVSIYALLLGMVGGGLGRFLPLFAEEVTGFTIERAGLVFAVQGLVAVPARLAAGVALDRGASARTMMTLLGVFGAVALLIIAAATEARPSLLWIGTVLAGLTLGTWNTAANLSMIRMKEHAGRATGRLMAGFFLGLTIGGPLVGWSIDRFSYTPAWLASSVVALAAAVVVAAGAERPDNEDSIGTLDT